MTGDCKKKNFKSLFHMENEKKTNFKLLFHIQKEGVLSTFGDLYILELQ